ncbi:YciI family protein [Nitrincola sp. MINF-07-Sa-05]|uniref:YciI family protein n=1 Tax=Nitrincola salilacus TaxID=3400273 RepID=UPI0039182A77
MKFMLMRKADANTEQGIMPSEELLATMVDYNEQMLKAGVFVSGNGLTPSKEGCRIDFKDGKPMVIDGPFTETKELLAGYTILEADSLEEAITWAKRWPTLDSDGNVTLELRRFYDLEDFAPGDGIDRHRAMGEQLSRMPSSICLHLGFNGQCREAMTYYAELLGGNIEMMASYRETPMADEIAAEQLDLIIHSQINIGGRRIMGADAPAGYYSPVQGASVQLEYENLEQARQIFQQLAEGGTIIMPFEPTFWAQGFGMLTDRFGIAWMINGGMLGQDTCPAQK